jgi:hypothetical protein
MRRLALTLTLALAAAASAVSACARQASAAPQTSDPASRGKPTAPVTIEGRLAEGTGRVTVRFDADAKGVRIEVHGAEGLAVTSAATPVEKRTFARGETAAFDVAFTPGPGRSYLAVNVTGKFHGAGRRAAVASFPVGEPTAEQRKAGGTVMESDGERIKVVVPAP